MSIPRCEVCKKKLGLMEYKCKCEKLFCISHLQAETHSCTFDYKKEMKLHLKKQSEDIEHLKNKKNFERI
jgi:AN1-like Zinc finger